MVSHLKVVLYCRVSTIADQDPEVQVSELKQYCEARKWLISKIIIDHGYSGGTDKRPGLKELMTLVKARKVDAVLVVKMDRLFRSLKHLVLILDELLSLGVLFVSLKDQIDLSTASGRLMVQVIGAFAEFERSLVRERTMAGLAYARSQGKTLGRPKTRNDDAIINLRTKGLSYSQIQKALNISRPAVYRALLSVGGTKRSKNPFQKIQSNQGGNDDS